MGTEYHGVVPALAILLMLLLVLVLCQFVSMPCTVWYNYGILRRSSVLCKLAIILIDLTVRFLFFVFLFFSLFFFSVLFLSFRGLSLALTTRLFLVSSLADRCCTCVHR